MTNQDAVVQTEEENVTSQDSSPQSEEPTIEAQTSQETVVEPTEETEESAVTKQMTKEEREAFQRMRLENKKLKEEMKARQRSESAFDVFKPKPAAQGVDINNFVDPTSGNVDWNSYNQAVVQNANAQASQTVQDQLDEERARNKYPEVFANPKLEEAIAGQWFAAKLQGRKVSVSDIARDFSELVGKTVSKAEKVAEKRGAEQALAELTPKEEASLQAQGTTNAGKVKAMEDEQDLLVKARYGSDDALADLVGRVSWKQK